jgi:glucose-6-phosphate 1-dehydrogenase
MSDLPATVIVLYGGTGDLAKRMVLPAFFDLYARGLLPAQWKLVGNGRGDVAHEDFRGHVRQVLDEFGTAPTEEQWADFSANVLFAGGGFRAEDGGQLPDMIEHTREELGADAQLVHYLAIPPSAFAPTTEAINEHGLASGSKIVYEKPYGTSLDSFRKLDVLVHQVFDEDQVFRIDHFLGKEATQNVHMLRFANTMIAGVWNREFVEEVQIDVPETLDIADRAEFYDATGAALDMLVTHLFQVAAEVAMEPPLSFSPDDLQEAREAVISAFRPLNPDQVVLGQFEGYPQTDGIDEDSTTDTYVAAKLWVDTDRWRDVPFVLRTGKRLAGGAQRLSLLFRPPDGPLHSAGRMPEVLGFDLQGSGRILMELTVKKPGPEFLPDDVDHVLRLDQVAEGSMAPYTSLIFDVLRGDRSLFTSSAGLASAFTAFAPVQGPDRPAVISYPADSWGPPEADRLTGRFGWLLDRE